MEFSEITTILSLLLTFSSIYMNKKIVELNNEHNEEMKKLEYKYDLIKLDTVHKRELFEEFLESLGNIYVGYNHEEGISFSEDEKREITEKYNLLLPYISREILPKFNNFVSYVVNSPRVYYNEIAMDLDDHIIPYIRKELEINSIGDVE